jgi:hypothetical protein
VEKKVMEEVNVQNLKNQSGATIVREKVICQMPVQTLQKKEKDQHKLADVVDRKVICQMIAQTNHLWNAETANKKVTCLETALSHQKLLSVSIANKRDICQENVKTLLRKERQE